MITPISFEGILCEVRSCVTLWRIIKASEGLERDPSNSVSSSISQPEVSQNIRGERFKIFEDLLLEPLVTLPLYIKRDMHPFIFEFILYCISNILLILVMFFEYTFINLSNKVTLNSDALTLPLDT